ncbi:hypothetical protein ERO13_A08G211001v2 [Gossypium hirsutum]|nr:hypothetical protein ERO13_A08G211001v2 [Gossypium hirsutum]
MMAKGKAGESNPYTVLSLLSSVLERSVRGNEKLFGGIEKLRMLLPYSMVSRAPSLNLRQQFLLCRCSYIYTDSCNELRYLTSQRARLLLRCHGSCKFMDDQWVCRHYNNAYYAKVGGISREEMNRLEMRFLFDLDFQLNVTTEVFNKYWLMIQQEGGLETQTALQTQAYCLKKDESGRGRRLTGVHRGRAL